MLRCGLVLATLAVVGCHDAPARPAPRPTAPAQASRALLEQALTTALADAAKARTLIPPPPPPAPLPSDDDDDTAQALADRLMALGLDDSVGVLGLRGVGPDLDPDDDPDDDPDGVVGGVVGGVLGGSLSPPPPPAPVTVQLLSDSDTVGAASLARLTDLLRVSAEVCRRQALADDALTDELVATVSLGSTGTGPLVVHVSGAGPLTDCLRRMPRNADLAAGSAVTFQLTIPGP